MDLENEVREDVVEKILKSLGEDFEELEEFYIAKKDLEVMPCLPEDIGNELVLLRYQDMIDVETREEEIFVKLRDIGENYHIGKFCDSESLLSKDYERVEESELMEVATLIGDKIKMGDKSFHLSDIERFIDKSDEKRTPYPELNILSGLGYIEICIEDGELFYVPNEERVDEFKSIADYQVRNNPGPLYQFTRNYSEEDSENLRGETELIEELGF